MHPASLFGLWACLAPALLFFKAFARPIPLTPSAHEQSTIKTSHADPISERLTGLPLTKMATLLELPAELQHNVVEYVDIPSPYSPSTIKTDLSLGISTLRHAEPLSCLESDAGSHTAIPLSGRCLSSRIGRRSSRIYLHLKPRRLTTYPDSSGHRSLPFDAIVQFKEATTFSL